MSIQIQGETYIKATDLALEIGTTRQSLWRWRKNGVIPTGQKYRNQQVVFSVAEANQIREYANRITLANIASPKKKNNKLTAISLFCGCGGMDLGFHKAGFDILWANDFNIDCCETYRKYFSRETGKDVLYPGDISKVPIPAKSQIGNLTVLLGGFPCQAYSNAGQRKGIDDHRGLLYEHCLNYIDAYNPQFTIFENVRGLLTIKGREKYLIEEICDDLLERGYEVHLKLLKASDYLVPQNRLRVFIIGVRIDNQMPVYRFPTPVTGIDLSLGSLLNIPVGTPNQQDITTLNPQAYEIGAMVPEGGSWKDIPYEKLPPRLQRIRDDIRRYRWPNFYRKFSRDEIAGTITAAFKPENAGVWHPTENRTFSAREIARIQSFPDDFEFFGKSIKSIYQMIGNAVPPLLAKAIAESIKQSIKGEINSSQVADYHDVRCKGKPINPKTSELIYSSPKFNAKKKVQNDRKGA